MSLTLGSELTLAKMYVGIDDPDAANYIALVEAADTAAGSPGGLETATKVAIHSFVKGCKADGIWPAIKASCILAGARTLNGALQPLTGTAPNKFGTAANWNYDRKDGLQGDGTTNYLNSGRALNADPQNNNHMACYATELATGSFDIYIGRGSAGTQGVTAIGRNSNTNLFFYCRNTTAFLTPSGTHVTGFMGISRDSANSFVGRSANSSLIYSALSQTPSTLDIGVFNNIDQSLHSNARLAFYSIGESLDLQKLDARVTDLITAIGVAF